MSDAGVVEGFIAGAVGGVSVVLVGHPLDTIKVRLQNQSSTSKLYNGFFDCIVKTFKNEGIRGFYKGMGAPIVAVSPLIALSFGGYNLGKKIQKTDDGPLSLPQIFLAGMISGMATSFVIIPGERIKCLLQVQSGATEKLYNGPLDCVRKIARQEGIRGFYKGSTLTLLRDVPSGGVFYYVNEALIRGMLGNERQRDEVTFGEILFAGGAAGSAFWISAIVPDTMKTLQQVAPVGMYKSLPHLFSKTFKEEGVRGFFKGLTPVMIRSFPVNAACLLGYEATLLLLKD